MIEDLGYTVRFDDLWELDGYVPQKCNSVVAFYGILPKKRSIKKSYIEVKVGQKFCIFSPYSNKYFIRQLHSADELRPLVRFINDKNLFLLLTPEEEEEQAKLLKRLSLHSFEQYTQLVALNVQLEAVHEQFQGKAGYITKVHQLEQEIKTLKE